MELRSKEQILSAKKCCDIFTNDASIAKKEYHEYAKLYHTDVIGNDDIMSIVSSLYSKAEKMLKDGIWDDAFMKNIKCKDGKTIQIKYRTKRETGACTVYETASTLVMLFAKNNKKYFDAFVKNTEHFNYKDSKIEEKYKDEMPEMYRHSETETGDWVIVVKKTGEVTSLSNILAYYNNQIPERHATWIMSRLHGWLCFMQVHDIVHNGITVDNLYLSPKYHTSMLYGGWQYSTRVGEKMIGVPQDVYNIMNSKVRTDKKSEHNTDFESVMQIGRKLFSGENAKKCPIIAEYFNTYTSCDVFEAFEKWTEVIYRQFGERKFIEWVEIDDSSKIQKMCEKLNLE